MTSSSRNLLTATLLLAVLAGASGASAQERERGFDFAAIDTNGDGEISTTEMEAHRNARFARIDANGDGQVDASELQRAADAQRETRQEARAARMLERADTDDDGVLSQSEMQANRRGGDMFERLDTDDSGTLSQAEIEAARERGHDRRAGARPSRG